MKPSDNRECKKLALPGCTPNERPPKMNWAGFILTLRTPKMPKPMVPAITKTMIRSAIEEFIGVSSADQPKIEKPALAKPKRRNRPAETGAQRSWVPNDSRETVPGPERETELPRRRLSRS